MSDTQEIVDLFQNKYKILSDSLNDLNIKIIKNSEKIISLNNEEKEVKFVEYIKNYIQFFTETFSKFEKEHQLPFYGLCGELFRDSFPSKIILNQQQKQQPQQPQPIPTIKAELIANEIKKEEPKNIPNEKLINKVDKTLSISSISEIDDELSVFSSSNESDKFPFLLLEWNTEYKMKISYMKSPTLFYLHLESSSSFLNQINKTLHDKYSALENNQLLITKPKINSIVAAQYSKDSYWYRAQIISVDKKKQTSFVYYIDYGNSETLPLAKLRKLDEKHLIHKGQAVPCSLIYAVPSKGNQWPVDTIKRFQSLILNSKLSVMIFPEKDWPIYFCTIKIIGSKNNNDILDTLIQENLAVLQNDTLKQISTLLPMLKSEKYLPELTVQTKSLEIPNTIKYGSNLNLAAKSSSIGNSNNKQLTGVKTVPTRTIQLSDDDCLMFDCEVVLVKNPSEFYIRPLTESIDDYSMLEKEMLNYYKSNYVYKNKHHYLHDRVSAVNYKSVYYRASRVSSDIKNEFHLMYFIDFGIQHKCPSNDIYPLQEQFCRLPAKLIKCSLHGITNFLTRDRNWSVQSIEWFKKEILRHECFLASSHEDKNKLEIPFEKTFEMILTIMQDDLLYTFNDELVRLGFAETVCLPTRVVELNIKDLDRKFAVHEENFRKKRVEDYVESCLANTNEGFDEDDDDIQMDKEVDIQTTKKTSEEKADIANTTKQSFKSNASQKPPPSITTAKSIISQKPPSVHKSPVSQKSPSITIDNIPPPTPTQGQNKQVEENFQNNSGYELYVQEFAKIHSCDILHARVDAYLEWKNLTPFQQSKYDRTPTPTQGQQKQVVEHYRPREKEVKKDELEKWNPMKEDFSSARNIYNYDNENVDCALYGYSRNHQQDFCRDFQRGFCPRKRCPFIHSKAEKEIEFGYYKILIDKPDYLSRGNSILVEIFELNGVHCLHAHVYAFWDYDVKCFVEVNTLIELTDRMKAYYGKRRFLKNKTLKPHNCGELVVVYRQEEDLWLRARIINSITGTQNDDTIYEVELIDKGQCAYIDLKNVYPIEPAFLHYYQQVIQMELVNIKFNSHSDELTIQECIDSIVQGKLLYVDILGEDLIGGKFLVELSGDHILTDLLIDMKFAQSI